MTDWLYNQRSEQLQREQAPGECVRLFITVKQEGDARKMTIMAPLNHKISMLKRLIEREYSDLFPHEPTFICAKLEDEFGYSLSNASYVSELLKSADRLFAVPETFSKDLIGKMHVTHDLNELTFMLKSITQTIIAKLAEADLGSPQTQLEILQLSVPIGFTLQQKAINHNTALTLKKILESERLQFLEDPTYSLITQLLVKLLQFWTNDLIFQDQFLLNLTVDVLELLLKSAAFAQQYKNPQIINSLMSVSKLEFVSAQTRSRIIKLISYLSRPTFQNHYQPKPYDAPLELPQSRQRRNQQNQPQLGYEPEERKELQGQDRSKYGYVPSMANSKRPPSNRKFEPVKQQPTMPGDQYEEPGNGYDQPLSQPKQHPYSNQYQPHYPQQFSQGLQANYRSMSPAQKPQPIVYSKPFGQSQQFGSGQRTPLPGRNQASSYAQGYPFDPQQQVFDGLVQDHLSLIASSESNEEILQFAVQNLSEGIETTIHQIMDNSEAFKKIVCLLEVAMNPNYLGMQLQILEQVAKNMNEARAKEGIKLRLIQRIMKAFTYQPKEFQNTLYDLLSATLKMSEFQADVLTIVSMIESPYQRISILGLKIMALMTDPQRLNASNTAMQYENYIKSLMDWTLDAQRGEEFQYNALVTLANLALNDHIRPQILHLKGIDFFIRVLRQSYRVDAQRVAAKALLNLSIKSRDTKLTIVSEMEEELKRMQRGELDTVVAGYLQTLIASRDRGQLLA